MRAFLLLMLAGTVLSGHARAGNVDWRLDQLEYESRQQRYDLEALDRQRMLDEVDARDRAARATDQAAIDRLERANGSLRAPQRSSPQVVVVMPPPAARKPAFDLDKDYVPTTPSSSEKSAMMKNWPWAR